MPLSVDNIVQQNSGTFEGTSGTASLPSAITGTNCVIIVTAAAGPLGNNLYDPPDNFPDVFIQIGEGAIQPNRNTVTAYSCRAPAHNSWTIHNTNSGDGASHLVAWAAFEVEEWQTDPVYTPVSHGADFGGVAAATTLVSSATTRVVPSTSTGPSFTFESLGLQVVAASRADTTVPVVSGYDSNYFEVVQTSITNASTALTLAVAFGPYYTSGNFDAGLSVSPDAYVSTDLVLLYGYAARRLPKYYLIFGAEVGTLTNATNWTFPSGTLPYGIPVVRGTVGTPEIVSNIKRTGNYALKLSSTTAAESVTVMSDAFSNTLPNPGPTNSVSLRVQYYFDGSLPGVDVELLSIEASGSLANGIKLVYRTASQKLGVQVDSGTEVLCDTAVSVGKWIGVDLRAYVGSAVTHKADWQVDYDSLDAAAGPVAQTTAVGTRILEDSVSLLRVGWTTSTTATVYIDDIAVSRNYADYPHGDIRVVPLKVDPAGTPAVSGTSGNFRTFSNNGTLATWTAADTRSRLDDVPPTVGGTSDGLAQITVATNDYVDIPMETYALAPLYTARAARLYWWGWAASGNPATCDMKIIDGNSVVAYQASPLASGAGGFDFGFDDSTVMCMTAMLGGTTSGYTGSHARYYEITQAILDGLAVRWGYAEDANPDVGLHAILIELAVQPAAIYSVIEQEGGAFSVYVRQDPLNSAVASWLVTTPSGTRGATLTWTIDGVDGSQYVGPNTVYEKSVGAADIRTATTVGLIPDSS
jgi:hypothetical protein